SAVTAIKAAARSFAVQPRAAYLQTLGEAQSAANAEFVNIMWMSGDGAQSDLAATERTLTRLQGNFAQLQNEYRRLGIDSDAGIRPGLNRAAVEVERIITRDTSSLNATTARGLLESLASMRRFEAAYMLDRNFDDRTGFNAELDKLGKTLDETVADDAVKAPIREALRGYAGAFETWLASDREIASRVAGIDSDAEFLIRSADASVERSKPQRNLATAALHLSQARTRNVIISVGVAAALLGIGFSVWIGLTITRPLAGLGEVMKRLADGDASARIPSLGDKH